jgi:hypothetical protein
MELLWERGPMQGHLRARDLNSKGMGPEFREQTLTTLFEFITKCKEQVEPFFHRWMARIRLRGRSHFMCMIHDFSVPSFIEAPKVYREGKVPSKYTRKNLCLVRLFP